MVIMKFSTISIKTLLLAMILAGIWTTTQAYDFGVDNIYYNISSEANKTVTVTYKSRNVVPGSYRDTVIIPETVTYNDVTYTVTRIGWSTFNNCWYLKAVQLPSTITIIDESAFAGNSEVTSVNIPEGVTKISKSAFSGLPKLQGMVLPSTLTYIGESAFANCSSFTHVNIPASVTTIGDGAFAGCSGISSWQVDDGNPVYDSRDGCNAIIHTATNTLIAGCQNSFIPSSVTTINKAAFWRIDNLTDIEIPSTVTSIGSSAFYGCNGLTHITIPNSISIINQQTFCFCANLQSIFIPETVDSIGYEAFAFCPKLTSITVANGNPVFDSRDGCNAIIRTANREIILGCKTTVIPTSIRRIGNYAFAGCSEATSLPIPNSVVYIGQEAYSNCSSLTSIDIPNSVRWIDYFAFGNCTGATTLNIPNSVYIVGNHAFNNCSSLKSVVMPNSINTIPDGLFANCEELVSIKLPDQIDAIGGSAFDNCKKLLEIELPNTVKEIGDFAFAGCWELKGITIPDSVKVIPEGTFTRTGLTYVVFGKSMESIGRWAFLSSYPTSVTCRGTTPPVMETNFETSVYNNAVLTIPGGTRDAYMATNYWYNFQNIKEVYTDIPGDSNGNGTVDIGDVSYMIDYLLGEDLGFFNTEGCDLNGNGIIDIGDVSRLIDMLLESEE